MIRTVGECYLVASILCTLSRPCVITVQFKCSYLVLVLSITETAVHTTLRHWIGGGGIWSRKAGIPSRSSARCLFGGVPESISWSKFHTEGGGKDLASILPGWPVKWLPENDKNILSGPSPLHNWNSGPYMYHFTALDGGGGWGIWLRKAGIPSRSSARCLCGGVPESISWRKISHWRRRQRPGQYSARLTSQVVAWKWQKKNNSSANNSRFSVGFQLIDYNCCKIMLGDYFSNDLFAFCFSFESFQIKETHWPVIVFCGVNCKTMLCDDSEQDFLLLLKKLLYSTHTMKSLPVKGLQVIFL